MQRAPTIAPGGRLAVAVAAVLFGTSATVTRLVDGMPQALTMAAWRQLIGGLALLAVAAALGQGVSRYRVRWAPTVLGGVAVVAFQVGFFAAVERLGVAPATMVVIGTGPIVAGVLDRVAHGTRPGRRWVAGVTIAVVGIALMSGGAGRLAPGDWLLAIGAGACFPVYGAATRSLLADRPPVAAIATVFGAGVIPAAALAAWAAGQGGHVVSAEASPGASTVAVVAVVAYLGVITTGAAYVLWAYGLARVPLRETVTITMLEPVAAFVLAAVVLHEPLGFARTAGALTVLAGIRVAATSARVTPGRRPLRRRARGDLVDVAHRLVGGERGEQHEDGADRQHDALVP